MSGGAMKLKSPPEDDRLFLSPRELAERWRCSRSSVDRIAKRAGIARYCLGSGRAGLVRYAREEVERFEQQRRA
ncbi:MAG: helix-turn-helix domain-containing protein [Planctomycetota bacterium]